MADIGSGLVAGGSLLGGLFGKSAADDAAQMQFAASQQAIQEQQRQHAQNRADLAPWREAGTNALARLQTLMGTDGGEGGLLQPFTGANLQDDPGYQFGMREGQKALENSAAARGGLLSGATGKALTRYGQDYAGTKFNEAFNRDRATKTGQYNMLAGLSGSGQTAANQVATFGANTANNVGNFLTQGANAQAAGRIGGTNALVGAMDDISGYYQLQDLLRR